MVDTFPGPQFSNALQGCQIQENFAYIFLKLLYLELNRKKPNFQVEKRQRRENFQKNFI
jgi:hypothetical protein